MMTGGKLPASALQKVDTYLREVATVNPKALLALNTPTAEEKLQQEKVRKKGKL